MISPCVILESDMDGRLKKVILGFTPAALLTLGFLGWRVLGREGSEPDAALSINLAGAPEEVWIENEPRGTTPFYSDTLEPGEVQVRIASWSARLTLTPGALTAVNLDIGRFTREEIFWLEESSETRISVVSDPEGAEVRLDGRGQGITPLYLPVTPGSYTLEVSQEGYEGASLKVQAQPGYKLNAWFKLRPKLVPESPQEIDLKDWGWEGKKDAVILLDYSIPNPEIFLSPDSWIRAVVECLAKTPQEKEPKYFLDREGKVRNPTGEIVSSKGEAEQFITAAYLGKGGEGVSQAAKDGFLEFLKASFPEELKPKVRVLPTGVGFLRVRSGPGTSYTEIAKIHPGETYPFLEDKSGWYRIVLDDGREGWIIGKYAEEVEK